MPRAALRYEVALEKYLRTAAEPEARAAAEFVETTSSFGTAHWQRCVIVPAYREHESLPTALASLLRPHTLIILVLNARAEDEEARASARASLAHVSAAGLSVEQRGEFSWVAHAEGAAVLVVDRFDQHPFSPRDGVGLARKIGADIAAALWSSGRLDSPWLHATDADALAPSDYFDHAFPADEHAEEAVAAWHPFVHRPVEEGETHARAVEEYEAYLHYYVEGLKLAQSPWAFHCIGSTQVFRADAYGAAHGYPKRLAGEDFYLFAKLAKLGAVVPLSGDPIVLEGRRSARVPFGTGVAVTQGMQDPHSRNVYHPACFVALKIWRLWWLSDATNSEIFPHSFSTDASIDRMCHGFCTAQRALQVAQTLRQQNPSESAFRRAKDLWFDSFRTLKFVHHARDHGLGELAIAEAQQELESLRPVFAGTQSQPTLPSNNRPSNNRPSLHSK